MGHALSLLLVEDDLSLLEELRLFLGDFFSDISVTTNSEDAYEVYLRKPFDLVITDIRLPKQNGLSLVERIKKKSPHQIIVVMSAYRDVEYFVKSIELGIYGFLTKPFDSQKLISMMLKITSELEHKKTQTDNQHRVLLAPNVLFDTHMKSLHVKNIAQELTQKEELLLALLVKNLNYFVPNEQIAEVVWQSDEVNSSTLRALIKRLRDKLGYEESISNLKGRGYKLSSISEVD